MKTINEAQIQNIIKESVKKILKESYHKENGIQRIAYENQDMKEKILEVAQFAQEIADIAKSEGRNKYIIPYRKIASEVYQMLNLWNFMDEDEL